MERRLGDSGATSASQRSVRVLCRTRPRVRLLWEMKKDRRWRLAGRPYMLRTISKRIRRQIVHVPCNSPKRRPRFARSRVSFRFALFNQKESESRPTSWCLFRLCVVG